jgi:hypothetical protein
MPQYWLKPFGTTEPPRRVDPNWTIGADLDDFMIITGPATPKKPPQMGGGDKILFHAVGHVRLYAAGELTGSPRYDPTFSEWGDRFPWIYPVRVDVWVPNVLDGPRTTDVAPRRAMGHLQTGGPYAALTREQYEALVQELLNVPTVRRRDDVDPPAR